MKELKSLFTLYGPRRVSGNSALRVRGTLRLPLSVEKILFSLFLFCLVTAVGCQNEYTPKPKGYFKVTFPEHTYRQYSPDYCPFSFEYPVYANIDKDTVFFDTKPENPCWMNMMFPEYNAAVYLSYKEINESHPLGKLIEDAHTLTYRHSVKANFIDEGTIKTPNHVYGLYYDVGGNAASNIQFFVTDSVHHFIRGSLYFNNEPNADSLAPVINFVKKDIEHMISTLKWK